METIGIIYEITGNPYFNQGENTNDRISEYTYPSEINDICKAFKANYYQFEVIDGAHDLLRRERELKKQCCIFFNKSIGFKGLERKSIVPTLGQFYQLPIIGSTAYSMALARHKHHTNRLLHGLGFLTPQSQIVFHSRTAIAIGKYPVIVKPNAESDSLGIDDNSVCFNLVQVMQKTEEILNLFGDAVTIEEFIAGDEIKVGVIGTQEAATAVGAVKVLKNGKTIAGSLQTRSDVLSDNLAYVPFDESPLRSSVLNIAENIHRNLELTDYSRIDFRIGDNKQIYCMEVSTHPDIAKSGSSFINAALQHYDDYAAVIDAIVNAARRRLNV